MLDSLTLLKLLSFIAGMLGLIYLAYKITKKLAWHQDENVTKLVTVLEYRRIDQKNSLCVVKICNNHYLLALGSDAIYLEKLNDLE